jgi:hypothetical protein
MNENWQSVAAIAVVILTAAVFAWRLARRKKPGCGGGCGCAPPHKPEAKGSDAPH